MPSNSAKAKLRRAKRHLIAAKILLGGLPSAFWQSEQTAKIIDELTDDLTETQRKIKAISPDDLKKVSNMAR